MPHSRPRRLDHYRCRLTTLGLAALLLLTGRAAASTTEPSTAAAGMTLRVQQLVDTMRVDMGVTSEVAVELVADNPLKASVQPVKGPERTFRLSIEQGFAERLTDEELRAVIAHELGHVWIYTHHPFLQTEQLANHIALKVVSRDALEKVYGKVFSNAGDAGSLPRLPDPAAIVTVVEPGPQN